MAPPKPSPHAIQYGMLTGIPLLPSQRADVWNVISGAGLEPSDFRWHPAGPFYNRRYPSNLVYMASPEIARVGPFHFLFGDFGMIRYFPGRSLDGVARHEDAYVQGWEDRLGYLKGWTALLRRELAAGDPWAALISAQDLSRLASSSTDNRPFTDSERLAIRRQLDLLSERVNANPLLTKEQITAIVSGLAYLSEAATRLGRKDWLTLAMGTVSNIIVGVALNSSQVSTIAAHIFNGAKGLLP